MSCRHTAKPDFQGMKSLSSREWFDQHEFCLYSQSRAGTSSASLPVIARGTARRYHVGLLCEKLYRASRDLTESAYCFAPKENFVRIAQWMAFILQILGSVRCLSVCSVCLSVTLVYCGQTVRWIKMKLGMQVGLGPAHIVLDGDPAPLPKGT